MVIECAQRRQHAMPMQVYEEVRCHPKVTCTSIDEAHTFQQLQLQHGDILLVQQALTEV